MKSRLISAVVIGILVALISSGGSEAVRVIFRNTRMLDDNSHSTAHILRSGGIRPVCGSGQMYDTHGMCRSAVYF